MDSEKFQTKAVKLITKVPKKAIDVVNFLDTIN